MPVQPFLRIRRRLVDRDDGRAGGWVGSLAGVDGFGGESHGYFRLIWLRIVSSVIARSFASSIALLIITERRESPSNGRKTVPAPTLAMPLACTIQRYWSFGSMSMFPQPR